MALPVSLSRSQLMWIGCAVLATGVAGLLVLGAGGGDAEAPPVSMPPAATVSAVTVSSGAYSGAVSGLADSGPEVAPEPQGIARVEKEGYQGIPNSELAHPSDPKDPNYPYADDDDQNADGNKSTN